jgi:hypothetical protein
MQQVALLLRHRYALARLKTLELLDTWGIFTLVFLVAGFVTLLIILPSFRLKTFRPYTKAQQKSDKRDASKYPKSKCFTLRFHLGGDCEEPA